VNKIFSAIADTRTVGKEFPLPVKAVMIDLDGTLLDTAADLAAAANSMLRELGKGDSRSRPFSPISARAYRNW
jgi:phosphoglycolate phosphatase